MTVFGVPLGLVICCLITLATWTSLVLTMVLPTRRRDGD
jgi:hypothetical protein